MSGAYASWKRDPSSSPTPLGWVGAAGVPAITGSQGVWSSSFSSQSQHSWYFLLLKKLLMSIRIKDQWLRDGWGSGLMWIVGRVVENSIHSLNKCWEIYLRMDFACETFFIVFCKGRSHCMCWTQTTRFLYSVSLCTKRREFVSLLALRLSQIGCTERWARNARPSQNLSMLQPGVTGVGICMTIYIPK